MTDEPHTLADVAKLFRSAHGGRPPVHGREFRHWINSPEGQAILAANGIEWWAKTEEKIAEEEAAEDAAEASKPQNILIEAVAAVVRASDQDKREAVLTAIAQWQESVGGEFAANTWANARGDAGEFLLHMIYTIYRACLPEPAPQKPRSRLRVVPPDE